MSLIDELRQDIKNSIVGTPTRPGGIIKFLAGIQEKIPRQIQQPIQKRTSDLGWFLGKLIKEPIKPYTPEEEKKVASLGPLFRLGLPARTPEEKKLQQEDIRSLALGFIGAAPAAKISPKVGAEVIAKFKPETEIGKKLITKFGEHPIVKIISEPKKFKTGAVMIQVETAGKKAWLPISKHVEWFAKPAEEVSKVAAPKLAQLEKEIGVLVNKPPAGILAQRAGAVSNIPPSIPPMMPPPATEDSIQKIIKALKEIKPIRKEQEALYTAERGKRLAKALAVGERIGGEKGFYAELGQLKGELPKAQFESLRGKIDQVDIDNLFNKIKESPLLNEWDKLSAREGLAKILGHYGGRIPTEGELGLLNKTFGPDFVNAVLEKRPLLSKIAEAGYQLANIPRSLMASFDLSAPLRQGLFLISKPKQFLSAFVNQFRYFGSEKAFKAAQEEIARRPTFELMRKYKLSLTEMDRILTSREEAFMSNWAEKIPLIGKAVKASGRAYIGFLNKLRADTFDDYIKQAEKLGLKPKDNPVMLRDLANYINAATGRGSLGLLERAAVPLNSFFFSPRLMASRLTLLNPYYYVKLDPFVRKQALKSLFTLAGTGLSVLGLAKMGGAEVGSDPRSADFGKIKIGNTRLDIWGGFQQYIRAAAQLISGQVVSSTTGKVTTLGEGYKPLTRLDILQRVLEAKQAPIISFATSLLKGQSATGEEISVPKEIAQRFIPMVAQDAYDLLNEGRSTKIPLVLLPIFGVGMQTYPSGLEYELGREMKKELTPNIEEDLRRDIRNITTR